MKKLFGAALAFAALSHTAAYACTTDELTAKAMAVSTRIQDMAQKDPQKASDWSQRFAAQQQPSTQPKTVDEICKLYDDMLAGMN